MKKQIRRTLDRMLSAKGPAWAFLIRSLQACCLFLSLTVILLILGERDGELRYVHTAYIFRDYAQLALLLGAIVPPCLEEFLGQGHGNPPGSSGR